MMLNLCDDVQINVKYICKITNILIPIPYQAK